MHCRTPPTFAGYFRRLFSVSVPRAARHHRTHYEALGVGPHADKREASRRFSVRRPLSKRIMQQIKKAFYELAKKHHPDRNPGENVEAHKEFLHISEAYEVRFDQSSKP